MLTVEKLRKALAILGESADRHYWIVRGDLTPTQRAELQARLDAIEREIDRRDREGQ